MIERVINLHLFTEKQKEALYSLDKNVVITAGAGTGKTRTLVGRYLSLLAAGILPSQIAAITFTEKAAREMRNRIRNDLRLLYQQSEGEEEKEFWQKFEGQIDSARIGTIHSLCAEILRAHPAEAGIDPRFDVIEEGWATLLRNEAVDFSLAIAAEADQYSQIFEYIEAKELRKILSRLITNRLEASTARKINPDAAGMLGNLIRFFHDSPEVSEKADYLREMVQMGHLVADVGENFAPKIVDFLEHWKEIEDLISIGEIFQASENIHIVRKGHMNMRGGKRNSLAKEAFKELRDLIDASLGLIVGGDSPPSFEIEAAYASLIPLIWQLFDIVDNHYRSALDDRQSLDFDDLEQRALEVLRLEEIQRHWQGLLMHTLVDEFQDTNQRQREIVNALTGGEANNLFIVGDARQSIYKFRGADVTVFRSAQQEIKDAGGELIQLDKTFRYHQPLSDCLTTLLEPIMGSDDDPDRPYHVPYSTLISHRPQSEEKIKDPYVQFVLAEVEDTSNGRNAAAQTLIQHLIGMYERKEIESWDDVAILSRASKGFIAYEKALNNAGIPYVTTAGQGFYERPEIRDMLNILNALSNPWDDLAVSGMLRSPAFGLSDEALYLIRKTDRGLVSFQKAFLENFPDLNESDQVCYDRAKNFLQEVQPLANQTRVADLLKLIIDRLNYRAILMASGGRLVRNLDKLLEDAFASDMIQINTFLQYVHSLRDVGAREGEAPTVAENSVRLMTIHKAKGLEFKVVVLADAQRSSPPMSSPVFVDGQNGLTVKLSRSEVQSILYEDSKTFDREKSAAEANRMLYVALTRAKEKVLVSGYFQSGKSPRGWLKELTQSIDWDITNRGSISLENIGGVISSEVEIGNKVISPSVEQIQSTSKGSNLYQPYKISLPLIDTDSDIHEDDLTIKTWRATGYKLHPPAIVVGELFHQAVERWIFPDNDNFTVFMETLAIKDGVVNQAQRSTVIKQVSTFLKRFQSHPLYNEIVSSDERYHELPYSTLGVHEDPDNGIIDLIYKQTDDNWMIIDFKTDEIRNEDKFTELFEKYSGQISRYQKAAQRFLGRTDAKVFFLDYFGEVRVESI